MRKFMVWSAAAIVLLMGMARAVVADKAEAPKAVTAAVLAAFPEAKVTGAKAGDEGIDVWAVTFEVGGRKLDADVTPDGTLIETEEAVDVKDVPAPALEAIKRAATGATIKLYEVSVRYATVDKAAKTATKLASPVKTFEADLEKDGMAAEVGVTADGAVVQAPRWEKPKKD